MAQFGKGNTEIIMDCLFEDCDEPIVVPLSFELFLVRVVTGNPRAVGTVVPDYTDLFKHLKTHGGGTWTSEHQRAQLRG